MFRRVLFLFVLIVCAAHAFGNDRADALRKSMYAAPDSGKAAIMINIAKIFRDENVDSCIRWAQSASDMGYSTRQYHAMIDARTLLSQIALERRDYTVATRHLTVIRDIALRERYWDKAMENFNAMAQTWLLRTNYAEAVEFLKEGLTIAVDRNNLEMSKYFYQALIESYSKLNNMSAVCDYYELLMEVNRNIDALAYNNRIDALQTERENLIAAAEDAKNRKQQQVVVTRVFHTVVLVWAIIITAVFVFALIWFQIRHKAGIAKSIKVMSHKAEQLDLLLKDQEKSYHFLTNHVYTNINALSESIRLFEAIPGKKRLEADEQLNRINGEIIALYDFFQNFTLLLQIQSGQLKPKSTTVNIPHLTTNQLVDNENYAISKGIRLVNEVQNNTFAIGDEKLVNVVLRNIMSNAFKYAPKRAGNITVGTKIGTRIETMGVASEDAGFVEVWVTDDGAGMTQEQVGMLFDLSEKLTIPNDFESKGYGVGLAVCRAVIEGMNGRIWAETRPGEGFCMRFNLPRAMKTEVKTLSLAENNQEETISTEYTSDNPLLLSQ